MKDIDEITIHPDYLDHKVQIGAKLNEELCMKLIEFLKENYKYFSWSHEDMSGIDPSIMVHHLIIDEKFELVKQKR